MADSHHSHAARRIRRLAQVAARSFFDMAPPDDGAVLVSQLAQVIHQLFESLEAAEKERVRSLLRPVRTKPDLRAPPELVEWLRERLGAWGLGNWMSRFFPLPTSEHRAEGLRRLVKAWLDNESPPNRPKLLEAGIRSGLERATDSDRTLLEKSLQDFSRNKENQMAKLNFYFDPRGLPAEFDRDSFEAKAVEIIKTSLGMQLPDLRTIDNNNLDLQNDLIKNYIAFRAIEGMLLLDEQFSPESFGFRGAVEKAWIESLGTTRSFPDSNQRVTDVPNRTMYVEIASLIPSLNGGNTKIGIQEFAFVARYVIRGAADVPLGHPNFSSQVRLGIDRYVAGAPPFESLALPPLTGDDGADVEIEPPNVQAVALVYASYQLERLRLFHVIDRITELFMHGMLPIGFDAGGKAIDTYYWTSDQRLTEPARYMQYGRVLGAPGADVSKEVQPNREFDSLFMRFLSSLAEYDRQRRIGDLIDSRRRPLSLTGEQVRKAGRDLAANCSLYGWAGTHFAARRLNNHITTAVNILKLPQIQKSYGVSNPWQVVERVASTEFGQAPNIVKFRTMAEAGKTILDLVAKYAKVWSATTGKPLFTEQAPGLGDLVRNFVEGDIPLVDEEELLRQTQYWLAVNGIPDSQVDKMSQPADTTYSPSLPAYGGAHATPGAVASNGNLDKIREMVAAGNVPSLEQLKQMLPALKS